MAYPRSGRKPPRVWLLYDRMQIDSFLLEFIAGRGSRLTCSQAQFADLSGSNELTIIDTPRVSF